MQEITFSNFKIIICYLRKKSVKDSWVFYESTRKKKKLHSRQYITYIYTYIHSTCIIKLYLLYRLKNVLSLLAAPPLEAGASAALLAFLNSLKPSSNHCLLDDSHFGSH